ncbi:MAG: hypothetical protein KAT49_02205 [Methanomicrobia archaeon]|nr:hypothetical protein [Methanomicrobia archaeon]
MRCCICGKETEILQEGMCESCFSKEKSPFSIDKIIKLQICKHCGAFYLNKWEHGTIRDMTTKTVLYYLKPKKNFEIVDRIENIKKNQMQIDFSFRKEKTDVTIKLLAINGFKIEEDLFSEIIFEYTTCLTCSRVRGGYYEAVIQMRRKEGILDEKERDDITEIIEEITEENAVSKIINKKEGIDFYFISKKMATKTLEFLRSKYGGKIKKSFEVYGRDKSRAISVLRLPKYKKGMLIEHNDEILVVEEARNSLDVRTLSGERKRFLWKTVDRKEFTVLENPELENVMITEITPEKIQVMSLKNYDTFYLRKKDLPKDINIEVEKEYKAIRRENNLEIWWYYGR